jgi:Family of unknown function (DUF6174)
MPTSSPLRPTLQLLAVCLVATCARSPFGQRTDDLAGAQARWQSAGISSYDFDLQRVCYCVSEATGPVTISVRNGSFTAIVTTDSGTAVDSLLFQDYLTMDRVFATTRRFLDARPASFTASYDAAFGFPTRVTVDPIAQAVDDELTYAVLALRPIPSP